MLRIAILVALASPICSRPGFRSSVNHGKKPILRMGPDEQPNVENLKEPTWVTNLRNNIQTQIGKYGFDAARPDIKIMIEEANQAVNLDSNKQLYPEIRVPIKKPLRSEPNQTLKSLKGLGPKTELSWEKAFKAYIKELITTYGRTDLDRFVRPFVDSIERAKHVKIKDIDVNPYGDITINYVPSIEHYNNLSMSRLREDWMPRYTIAPDDRRK